MVRRREGECDRVEGIATVSVAVSDAKEVIVTVQRKVYKSDTLFALEAHDPTPALSSCAKFVDFPQQQERTTLFQLTRSRAAISPCFLFDSPIFPP